MLALRQESLPLFQTGIKEKMCIMGLFSKAVGIVYHHREMA